MDSTYDWIVVGGGIAGSAAAYELAHQGLSVLLLEAGLPLQATRCGYGGIPYWMGRTPLMQQLCQEGYARHQALPQELNAETQFRDLDLLLTVNADQDPHQALAQYTGCSTVPTVIGVSEACDREPLLNPEAIAGALLVRHAHVDPILLLRAYNQAFRRLNGKLKFEQVVQIDDDAELQVTTTADQFTCGNVLVCAGGLSRHLLSKAGLPVKQYFTHAEVLITPPLPFSLRTMIMPAEGDRATLEQQSTQPEQEARWSQESDQIVPPAIDPGAIQFLDQRLYIGQISRAIGDPFAPVDLAQSEATLRQIVGRVLPSLKDAPGNCHHCLVAFSSDGLPLVGPVAPGSRVQVFSGFAGPFALVPPLAKRFAAQVAGSADPLLADLLPQRGSLTAGL
ncbi:MAG: FAD-binding oxidoreductase [Cyanobacteria bacterium P01_A01_bin.135]